MGGYSRFLVGLTCFLQVMCAAAIMVVTALKLHHVDLKFDSKTWNTDVRNVCLLGKMENSANLCYLAYLSGGISVLATALLSLLQCCTCHLCGLGMLLDAVFAAAGTLMWAVVGSIFQHYNSLPAMAYVPRPEWRLSITILSFVACALFAFMALAAVYCMLAAACCGGCCGGSKGGRGGGRAQVVVRDVEAGSKPAGAGQFLAR